MIPTGAPLTFSFLLYGILALQRLADICPNGEWIESYLTCRGGEVALFWFHYSRKHAGYQREIYVMYSYIVHNTASCFMQAKEAWGERGRKLRSTGSEMTIKQQMGKQQELNHSFYGQIPQSPSWVKGMGTSEGGEDQESDAGREQRFWGGHTIQSCAMTWPHTGTGTERSLAWQS